MIDNMVERAQKDLALDEFIDSEAKKIAIEREKLGRKKNLSGGGNHI